MQDVSMLDKEEHYAYKFSIVMAVYNVAPFLNEAVDSLLQQTIGFEENVQLILVDDGSQDSSGQICDDYKEQYPNNIVVIHKENGGVSSARNEGLKYIKGKYVNFLDSDDKFSLNTFEKVFNFFLENEKYVDVVSVPRLFFEGKTGNHNLNYKFKKGSRVINLLKEWNVVQNTTSTAFFSSKAIKNLKYNEKMKYCEDTLYVCYVLLLKKTLGVVTDCYHYTRKRIGGEQSATQVMESDKDFFLVPIRELSNTLINYCRKRYNFIPKFIQFILMYELQWKLILPNYPLNMTEQEIKKYELDLRNVLMFIDDDVILGQKNMNKEYKNSCLERKYGCKAKIIDVYGEDFLYYGNTILTSVKELKCSIDFLKIENGYLICEGTFFSIIESKNIEIVLLCNGKVIKTTNQIINKDKQSLGKQIRSLINFKFKVILRQDEKYEIKIAYLMNDKLVTMENVCFGEFSPINNKYSKQYCNIDGWIIKSIENNIYLEKSDFMKVLKSEILFLQEILQAKEQGYKKAFLARIGVHVIKKFLKKDIWLISDRVNKADDNGEAFFSYLMHNKKRVKIYFVIGGNSIDFDRLKKNGSLLVQNSFKHKMAHLLSSNIISSQADCFTTNPFIGYSEPYRDILYRQKFIFLQHGVTKDDLSGWLNRKKKNISLFITAAEPEYQSILKYDYDYDSSIVKLTGFPRHDRLYHDEKNFITIVPTWRAALVTGLDANTGLRKVKNGFALSSYNKMYSSLLTNKKLILAAKESGYQIQFLPHPNMINGMQYMKISSEIKIVDLEMPYRMVFAESDLLITDYSSVAFDFTYLRKPVIYFQQDKEEFFANHTYTKGYFDYERDGFGEVCYDLDTLVDTIIEYMKNDCQLKDKYRRRIDNFFAYNDKNNCQRVYDEIMKL